MLIIKTGNAPGHIFSERKRNIHTKETKKTPRLTQSLKARMNTMIRSLEREIIDEENTFIFKVFCGANDPQEIPTGALRRGTGRRWRNGNRKGKERTLHVARPRPLPADSHRTRLWGCGWPGSYVTFPPCTASERASRRHSRHGRAQAAATGRPLWPLSARPGCDPRALGGRRSSRSDCRTF